MRLHFNLLDKRAVVMHLHTLIGTYGQPVKEWQFIVDGFTVKYDDIKTLMSDAVYDEIESLINETKHQNQLATIAAAN